MGFAGFLLLGVMQAQALPEPPAMPRRAISARAMLPGSTIEVEDGDRKYTLFIPSLAKPSAEVVLTIHFHSAIWHALQEHVDRGVNGPVIAFYPGEGSSVYAQSFHDKDRLKRWMNRAIEELRKRGWPDDAQIKSIDVTSFSAGYGAVRELVQQPDVFKLLRRVILADSLYGGLYPPPDGPYRRVILEAHVKVWKPLMEAAIARDKTFAITFSEVPTETYASSSEMAAALVALGNGTLSTLEPGSLPATKDAEFPLKTRFDKGCFHVWGYGGKDGPAHITHARHLADIWKALDNVEAP